MRLMIDCISSDVVPVQRLYPAPDIIAGYDTGSPDIRWLPGTWSMWPNTVEKVHIDQGGTGAPVYSATVIDVEPGAWQPHEVPDWISKCTAERPTVYCDRSMLPDVLDTGWRGDLWLAIPTGSIPASPPDVGGCNVVAVQYMFSGDYDASVVFDDSWPHKPVTKEYEMINGTLTTDAFIPLPEGTFKSIMLYRDFLDATRTSVVRVAVHSAAHGYTVKEYTLDTASPVTVPFTQIDTDAVSLAVLSGLGPVGFTVV